MCRAGRVDIRLIADLRKAIWPLTCHVPGEEEREKRKGRGSPLPLPNPPLFSSPLPFHFPPRFAQAMNTHTIKQSLENQYFTTSVKSAFRVTFNMAFTCQAMNFSIKGNQRSVFLQLCNYTRIPSKNMGNNITNSKKFIQPPFPF